MPTNNPFLDSAAMSSGGSAVNYMNASTPSDTLWENDDDQPTPEPQADMTFTDLREKLQTALRDRQQRLQATAPGYEQSSTVQLQRSQYTVSVSDILHMVKPFTGVENAERWLQTFELYANFKNLLEIEKLGLFKLMMTEQASDWLTALPEVTTVSFSALVSAFKKRYDLSEAAKWKAEKDIWGRVQGKTESVDDYVTSMQLMANKVSMPAGTLKKAIIQGLQPELRLFVLNANAKDIQELLTVARTCEAARSADIHQTSNIDVLTDMVGSLVTKVSQLATTTDEHNIKRVTFADAAISSENSESQFKETVQQPPSSREYQTIISTSFQSAAVIISVN